MGCVCDVLARVDYKVASKIKPEYKNAIIRQYYI